MIFKNSECKHSWLHRYKIFKEFPQGVQEKCEICGDKVFFRVVNGRINNARYLSYHLRQTIPPIHRLFSHEFPGNKLIIKNG